MLANSLSGYRQHLTHPAVARSLALRASKDNSSPAELPQKDLLDVLFILRHGARVLERHQIPLIDHQHACATLARHQLCQTAVLLGDTLHCVNHKHDTVTASQSPKRCLDGLDLQLWVHTLPATRQRGVAFGLGHARATAYACRVNQRKVLAIGRDVNVTRVHGGSANVAHRSRLAANQSVHQAGLAHIGSPKDGQPHGTKLNARSLLHAHIQSFLGIVRILLRARR
mmetsp:Transcript_21053/g.65253  ORF Transcript_21053/g.65253 Transcript_21053/m.65253 type:complete len:227 (-) Transcript_21053:247-927(-)